MMSCAFYVVFVMCLCAVSAQARNIVVPPSGNLQAAIDSAQCGDTIILNAGATYFAPADFVAYTLPVKPCTDTSFITIRSSVVPPADGVRRRLN